MGGIPLKPVVISGTSIGAVNATFLAGRWQGSGLAAVERLADLWLKELAGSSCSGGAMRVRANPLPLLRAPCLLGQPVKTLGRLFRDLRFLIREALARLGGLVSGNGGTAVDRLLDLADFSEILTVEPLVEILRRHVDFEALQGDGTPLRIAATDWQGRVQVFENVDMTPSVGPRIVNASCAIPGLLPRVEVGENSFIDGSMLMYAPVLPAIRAGAQVVHLIHMNTDVASEPRPRGKNSMEALFRALSMMWQASIDNEMAWARTYNSFLAHLQGAGRSEPEIDVLLAEAGLWNRRPSVSRPRFLTVHSYFPAVGFEGTLAFTNLEQGRIADMIDQGFAETLRHDCTLCRCVLPPLRADRQSGADQKTRA